MCVASPIPAHGIYPYLSLKTMKTAAATATTRTKKRNIEMTVLGPIPETRDTFTCRYVTVLPVRHFVLMMEHGQKKNDHLPSTAKGTRTKTSLKSMECYKTERFGKG